MKKNLFVMATALLMCTQAMADIAAGRYNIVSRHSGLNLDIDNTVTAAGANAIQWSATGASNQQFDVQSLGGGKYAIRPVHTGMSLDVWEWSSEAGGEIRQWNYTGAANQQWMINDLGNGYYSIISVFNGLALDVWEWSTSPGGDIRQWQSTGGYNQQWSFKSVGGGSSGSGKGATCKSAGSVSVSSTIVVSGGVYDGGCKTFNATSALGDGSQNEDQKPVFRLENGATLKNVIIGKNGADGIHTYNGATVDNVKWTDVGEDALTVKKEGNVTIRNISGYNGSDKFFQINAPTKLNISNCIVDGAGKFLRQNGGTTFTMSVTVDNCDIANMSEGVFRTDSSSSTARITNSHLHNAGTLCIGKWKSCTKSNVTNY